MIRPSREFMVQQAVLNAAHKAFYRPIPALRVIDARHRWNRRAIPTFFATSVAQEYYKLEAQYA